MNSFKVSIATKKDLHTVSKLASRIIRAIPYYNKAAKANGVKEVSPARLADNLKSYKNSVIIARSNDGRLVGVLTHLTGLGMIDSIDWLVVDPNFRQGGVGRALVQRAISDARKRGAHKIWCDTRTNNVPINHFMKKLGFKKVAVFRKHSFKEDVIIWHKWI